MSKNVDLRKRLNLNYTIFSNQSSKNPNYHFANIYNKDDYIPDFLALYKKEHYLYGSTDNTTICFFEYDDIVNSIYGLCNAVYYNDKELLDLYSEELKGCHYFIMPDLSLTDDIEEWDLIHRHGIMRLTCIWIITKLRGHVIPLMTYNNEASFKNMVAGFEECEVVCFSTKGSISKPSKRKMLIKAVKYAVDNLPKLKRIIVYDVCKRNNHIDLIFKYAIDKGIKITVPDNTLKTCNSRKKVA